MYVSFSAFLSATRISSRVNINLVLYYTNDFSGSAWDIYFHRLHSCDLRTIPHLSPPFVFALVLHIVVPRIHRDPPIPQFSFSFRMYAEDPSDRAGVWVSVLEAFSNAGQHFFPILDFFPCVIELSVSILHVGKY